MLEQKAALPVVDELPMGRKSSSSIGAIGTIFRAGLSTNYRRKLPPPSSQGMAALVNVVPDFASSLPRFFLAKTNYR